MLLRFSVENWMSFRDEATLDLVATREEQHSGHIAAIQKYGLKLLPIAAIYGANASGKSNLVKALSFAQKFITDPPKANAVIPINPFRLSKETPGLLTGFRFEILIGETIYEYRFSVTDDRVVQEELKQINKASEETLFRRLEGKLDPIDQFPENSALRFAFEGTQDNQLYLTNSVSQKLEEFRPLYDWFAKNLFVILPTSRYGQLHEITDDNHPQFGRMTARLHDLDSGIAAFRQVDISPERTLPKGMIDSIAASLKEGQTLSLGPLSGEGAFLRRKEGNVIVRRLVSVHRSESGEEILFTFSEESDGTRRLLDLLPAFLFLEEELGPSTLVIDELDRSLHPNLTRNLIEHYLAQRTDSSRSQLIFTTHDTQLMTQDIFRRDEIWITERDQFGASKLVAFSEFKDVRKDKDIRKSYLQGRMGGVPRIRTASSPCEDEAQVR
jgi:AAA15 family ATPase/GTPase